MFDKYVGQREALAPLVAAIKASRATGRTLPNMLFLGGPGRGKTTLAKAVAEETGTFMVTLHGSSVLDRDDVGQKIMAAQRGYLFIDEVHALPRQLSEDLYRVIDEGKMTVEVPRVESQLVKTTKWIDTIEGLPEVERFLWRGPDYYFVYEVQAVKTKQTINQTIDLEPITIIGATTDEALLPEPFYSRLSALTVRLREYEVRELQEIAMHHARSMGMVLLPEAAEAIAQRSRRTPRRVEHLTANAANFAVALGTKTVDNEWIIDKGKVDAAMSAMGVDDLGLELPHRTILSKLARTERGMSRTTLAQSVGLPMRNLDTYWGDLVGLGLVEIQTRHQITNKGRNAI